MNGKLETDKASNHVACRLEKDHAIGLSAKTKAET